MPDFGRKGKMSSTNDEGDDKLREAVSKNEARAEWGGAAVVFGLVVEVVLTAAYRHGESIIGAWGPVFADALIALGVAAEILFARKARSKAETLQRRSDEKVAEANARASEANQKAEEAALALAELTAPRMLTTEQRGVEDLLAERGLMVTNESIRRWVLKFGPIIAKNLRAIRPKPHSRWHLDEMMVGERLPARLAGVVAISEHQSLGL
jgi:hypothetical protein